MRPFTLAAIVMLVFASSLGAQEPQERSPDLAQIAVRYIAAQEAVMESDAGSAQVETLLDFYSDDFVYHHPQFGARVTGRDALRRGISAHLGETADAEIEIKGILVNGNLVALALEEHARDVPGNGIIERRRMTVLTFRGDRIVQRIDA